MFNKKKKSLFSEEPVINHRTSETETSKHVLWGTSVAVMSVGRLNRQPQHHKPACFKLWNCPSGKKKMTHLKIITLFNLGMRRHRRMPRTRQRRLHRQLAVPQLRGEAAGGGRHSNSAHASHGTFSWICNSCAKKNNIKTDVFVRAQGSYHCGSCKSGFTGDQVKGCKPEISCGNSLTNPCDVNAQCILERDGSITCQVG